MARRALPALLLATTLAACQSTATPTGLPIVGEVSGVPGLGAEVTVSYDALGVPHILAGSDDDASYATGYVHARDRLFQMDFMRRAARGTLAEMLGSDALSNDVAIRTVFTAQAPVAAGLPNAGSYRIEEVITSTLPPAFRTYLQRYADGVNRYLADMAAGANGARVPAEYVAIASLPGTYTPTPWTVQDSIAIGRLQSWLLSESLTDEVNFGRLAQGFATACGSTPVTQCPIFALFSDITRSVPATRTSILPPPAAATGGSRAGAIRAPAPLQGSDVLRGLRAIKEMLGLRPGDPAGSNNWVMRSPLTGNAMVGNDPHLALQNPSVFYLAQVTSDTHNVGGVGFPGAPVFPIGHNDHVGWGDTVAYYDVTDVYYFPVAAGGLPANRVPVIETYKVRGDAPVTPNPPIIMVPDYGPVVAADASAYYTARWTGQEPTNELLAFFQLNLAKSVDEAFEAVRTFQVGAQNFVFADVNGNIGYYPHAYVPVRKAGCFGTPAGSPRLVYGAPGLVVPWAPMPGDGSCTWTGRIADAALPQAKNPAANRIVTANNDITGQLMGNDPFSAGADLYLYAFTDLGYRATRATTLLSAKAAGYTLDDFTAIQADNYSLFAADVVPGLLAWFQSGSAEITAKGLQPAVDLLTHWSSGANARRYTTPTGLASTNPSGARSADAEVVAASNASMLFHALVPRLAARLLDGPLSSVQVGGKPLDTRIFLSMTGGQTTAKYLAALAQYAAGGAPAVPLYTCLQSQCPVSLYAPAVVAALEDTVEFLSSVEAFGSALPSDWIWGRKHRATFDSLLDSAGVSLFNYGPFANDGGLYTVDVANFSWNDDGGDGFFQHAGPNVRFSAEMIAPGNVVWRAVVPGGAADFVQDPSYQNQIPLWLSNAPGVQPWSAADVQAAAVDRFVFRP
jgi:penicillin amidase